MVNETFQKVLKLQQGGYVYTSEALPGSVQQRDMQLDPNNYTLGPSSGTVPTASGKQAPSIDMTEFNKLKGDEADVQYVVSKVDDIQNEINTQAAQDPDYLSEQRGMAKIKELHLAVATAQSLVNERHDQRVKNNDTVINTNDAAGLFTENEKGEYYAKDNVTGKIDFVNSGLVNSNRSRFTPLTNSETNAHLQTDLALAKDTVAKQAVIAAMITTRGGEKLTSELNDAFSKAKLDSFSSDQLHDAATGAVINTTDGTQGIRTDSSSSSSNQRQLHAAVMDMMKGTALSPQAKKGLNQDADNELSKMFDGEKVRPDLREKKVKVDGKMYMFKDLDTIPNLKGKFWNQEAENFVFQKLSLAAEKFKQSSASHSTSLSNLTAAANGAMYTDLMLANSSLGTRTQETVNGITVPGSKMAIPSAALGSSTKPATFGQSQLGNVINLATFRLTNGDQLSQNLTMKGVTSKAVFMPILVDRNNVPVNFSGKEYERVQRAIDSYTQQLKTLDGERNANNGQISQELAQKYRNLNNTVMPHLQELVPENMKQQVSFQWGVSGEITAPQGGHWYSGREFHDSPTKTTQTDQATWNEANGLKHDDTSNTLVTVPFTAVVDMNKNIGQLMAGKEVNFREAQANTPLTSFTPNYESAIDKVFRGSMDPSSVGTTPGGTKRAFQY